MDEGLVCNVCGEYLTYSQVNEKRHDNLLNGDFLFECIYCNHTQWKYDSKPYFLKKKDEKCTNCNNEIIWNDNNKGKCSKCGLYYKVKE